MSSLFFPHFTCTESQLVPDSKIKVFFFIMPETYLETRNLHFQIFLQWITSQFQTLSTKDFVFRITEVTNISYDLAKGTSSWHDFRLLLPFISQKTQEGKGKVSCCQMPNTTKAISCNTFSSA